MLEAFSALFSFCFFFSQMRPLFFFLARCVLSLRVGIDEGWGRGRGEEERGVTLGNRVKSKTKKHDNNNTNEKKNTKIPDFVSRGFPFLSFLFLLL